MSASGKLFRACTAKLCAEASAGDDLEVVSVIWLGTKSCPLGPLCGPGALSCGCGASLRVSGVLSCGRSTSLCNQHLVVYHITLGSRQPPPSLNDS